MSLCLIVSSVLAVGQTTAPAGKEFTESQFKTYLDTQKNWLDETAKILHDSSNSRSGQAKLVAVGDYGQRFQSCLDRHQISRADFESIGERAAEAWTAVTYFDGAHKSALDRLDAQSAELTDRIAAEQKQLDIYRESQKNGWRLLAPDERDAAVKTATQEQQAALQEVKSRADDAAAAEADAAQHDADAKSADELAANPPADISPEGRSEYIQNKKNEAEAARVSAREARVQASDSRKSQAEAQALADAAAQRAAHPEIPVTDDQKSQAKSDNDAAVALHTNELKELNQAAQKIAAERTLLAQTAAQITKGVPPENIAMMRKYAQQYLDQYSQAHPTATQPSR